MKILVTGGGGFLGSEICRQLLARGEQVIAFQRSANDSLEKLGVEIQQGDISNAGQVEQASEGVDAIIHTAAKAGIWGSYDSYYQANVAGTQNIIAACHKYNIKNLVFTSSPSVVHGGGDIEGGNESLPYPEHFKAPYPATKALAEQMVMAANGPDLKTVSLRPHFIWGPGDNHLLPGLIARAKKGSIHLPGPHKLIDTVYVENAAKAHLLALDKLRSNPQSVTGKAYFISNDEPLPQQQIISALLEAAGQPVTIKSISPAIAKVIGSVMETVWKLLHLKSEPPLTHFAAEQLSTAHWYDISAAKAELGYQPDIGIEEGLQRLKSSFIAAGS